MLKPRVIIADMSEEYISVLQVRFIQEFFEKIELEIITNKEYFWNLFSKPQNVFLLIVSEEMYFPELQKHNLENIFVMTERDSGEKVIDVGVTYLFKYSNIEDLFHEIYNKSKILDVTKKKKATTQIIMVTSATGGSGKTTISMSLSKELTRKRKNVLYVNVARLQYFPIILNKKNETIPSDIYVRLHEPNTAVFEELKKYIAKEDFSFLLPFKAALLSLNIDISVFSEFLISARQHNEYDYIIVDTESTFDENFIKLLDVSNKVIFVSAQTHSGLKYTLQMMNNLNGVEEKALFVCNNLFQGVFKKEELELQVGLEFIEEIQYIENLDEIDMQGIDKIKLHKLVQIIL